MNPLSSLRSLSSNLRDGALALSSSWSRNLHKEITGPELTIDPTHLPLATGFAVLLGDAGVQVALSHQLSAEDLALLLDDVHTATVNRDGVPQRPGDIYLAAVSVDFLVDAMNAAFGEDHPLRQYVPSAEMVKEWMGLYMVSLGQNAWQVLLELDR